MQWSQPSRIRTALPPWPVSRSRSALAIRSPGGAVGKRQAVGWSEPSIAWRAHPSWGAESNPQFLHHAERLSQLYALLALQGPTVGLHPHEFKREVDAREL